MSLSSGQHDRAIGALVGLAAGDALGAPFEFGPPRPASQPLRQMRGGGGFGWSPGEWTDDTQMAICIAQVGATGLELGTDEALNAIGRAFVQWSAEANDVGVQTRAVLHAAGPDPTAVDLAMAARRHYEATGKGAGNGALMRTSPVALAYLDDSRSCAEAASAIAALTHGERDAGDACVIWCEGIRRAVKDASFDGVRDGVRLLPPESRPRWHNLLDEAESSGPGAFPNNGWVIHALQAAWSAIVRTPIPTDDPAGGVHACQHLELALEAAVRSGNDTDTVAAIAGQLLGAKWGLSAVPAKWRRVLHGWPGMRTRDLARLALLTTGRGQSWSANPRMDYSAWNLRPGAARHPRDPGLLIGSIAALYDKPPEVDAVVSLCRLGTAEAPTHGVAASDHLEVRLADSANDNPNLDFVLDDTVSAVEAMRSEGRTVLLHCVEGVSRTAAVAALYGMRRARENAVPLAAESAIAEVRGALGQARPAPFFVDALERLCPSL